MRRCHFGQKFARQHIARHQTVKETDSITGRSNQKAMVDPRRIVPGVIAPRGIGKVLGARRHAHRFKTKTIENEIPQGAADIPTDSLLDELANKQISDIGIAPAMPGIEIEAVGRNAVKQLAYLPRLLTASNSFVIGSKTAVVRNAGTVLEQLAQRKRTAIDPLVETEMTASDQLKGSRGQCGLGEAPPRDTRMIGTGFRSTVGVNPRSQEPSIRHAFRPR